MATNKDKDEVEKIDLEDEISDQLYTYTTIEEAIKQLETPPFPFNVYLSWFPLNRYPSYSHLNPNVPIEGYTHLDKYSIFLPDIEKSKHDYRDYRLIRLPNGLEALCISDKKAKICCVSSTVRTGFLDCLETPGLAHLCEHMILQGSKKYPTQKLGFYADQIHSLTTDRLTCFYVATYEQPFKVILDVFSRIFIDPMFPRKELRGQTDIIHQEYLKLCKEFRNGQIDEAIMHCCGNIGTLQNAQIRMNGNKWENKLLQKLTKFYERHYSANLIKLVVYGNKHVQKLINYVVDSFSAVPNRNLPPKHLYKPTTLEALNVPVIWHIKGEYHGLRLSFHLPDQTLLFASKPCALIESLFLNKNRGSIFYYLRYRKWARQIAVKWTRLLFIINLELTPEGYDYLDEVIKSIFSYIQIIRFSHLDAHLDKVINTKYVSFKNSTPESQSLVSQVEGLAARMQEPYPRKWLISASMLIKTDAMEPLNYTLESLVIGNCEINVVQKRFLLKDSMNEKSKCKLRYLPKDVHDFCQNPTIIQHLYLPVPE